MQQLNVVICGFDHYENIDVNPSYEVPEALVRDGIGEPSDVDDPLHDANVSIKTLDATRPDIVIATGLKHAAHSVAMERCATNLMNAARPDADNALPRFEPIIKDGPAAYWTRLPLRAIINDFARDGIPATLSSDAGTFVCNSLFYQLLHWTATQDRVLAGFVSFPPINGGSRLQNGLDLRQQVRAGRDVVRETVRYYLQPSSGDILIA